jgi:hypothetical protein
MKLKDGSGEDAKPYKGVAAPVEDGAEGAKLKGGYNEKANSGASTAKPKVGGAPFTDGATGEEIKPLNLKKD